MKKKILSLFVLMATAFLVVGCANDNLSTKKIPVFNQIPGDMLKPGQKVKIMSWNVQYMAGKNYIFWYDVADDTGKDTRPSAKDIALTLDQVAKVISKENPDIIIFQEIDENSKRTDYEDQLLLLLPKISKEYKYHASAFYHKCCYVPEPHIKGRVGLKLTTLSKYQIKKATRYQLALKDDMAIVKLFDLKRAVLETRHPVAGGKDFIVMNTHLSAFAQGDDTMHRQVVQIKSLMDKYTAAGNPWILGGDTNLLPPGGYYKLAEKHRVWYEPKSEIKLITDVYKSFPSMKEVNSKKRAKWFTHYPNDLEATGPDRTIDYIFYSDLIKLGKHKVATKEALDISDHMPLVGEFTLPR